MSDELSAPLMSTIDITNYCNLNCAYCYAHNNNASFMSKENVVKLVLELHSLNIWQIVISGGEPFLHPDILMILELILQHDVPINITTNGTVLSETQIAKLFSLQQQYPNQLYIQVSVDGHSVKINDILRGEGSKLFHNVNLMAKTGIKFGIGTVLHKYNIIHIKELLEKFYLKTSNFHFLGLMATHSVFKTSSNLFPTHIQMMEAFEIVSAFKKIHQEIPIEFPTPLSKKSERLKSKINCKGCSAAVTRMDINAMGDVFACHIADKSIMGNIYDNALHEIWRSDSAQNYRHATKPLCYRSALMS